MVGTSQKNQALRELLYILVGCILYALSVVWFIDPAHIIPGSVTGIAVIVKALFNTPIGVLNLAINVPLILVAVFYLGKKLLVYTGLTILLTSVMMDWWAFMPPFTEDMLLSSVFGGILMGIGLGLILKAGATTGGTTVVGRLVVRKYPNIPIGDVLMVGDFIIITVGSILLKDWDLLLYSILDLYICVIVINKVIYGLETKAAAVIYTTQSQTLKGQLEANLPCRTALLPGNKGVLCYCRKNAVSKLQKIMKVEDAQAEFISVDIDYASENFLAQNQPIKRQMPNNK